MTISRKALCIVYALIGLVALVGTWSNNLQYFHLGLVGANVAFWQELLGGAASRSITLDILYFLLAANIWMLLEARRLAMRWAWAYVLFGFFIAISAAFPAFLIHRERALAAREGSAGAGTLLARDLLGLAALAIVILGYTVLAFRKLAQ